MPLDKPDSASPEGATSPAPGARAEPGQYLTFVLAGIELAVPILSIREILAYQVPTRVPATPTAIRGVINLRGRVLPVIDLAHQLGLSGAPVDKRTCVVVIDVVWSGEPTALGIIADEVRSAVDLGPEDIEPPPPFGARIRLDFLTGVGKSEGALVLLLDIVKVLSPEELLHAVELGERGRSDGALSEQGAP